MNLYILDTVGNIHNFSRACHTRVGREKYGDTSQLYLEYEHKSVVLETGTFAAVTSLRDKLVAKIREKIKSGNRDHVIDLHELGMENKGS